jgi:hypothetical protein
LAALKKAATAMRRAVVGTNILADFDETKSQVRARDGRRLMKEDEEVDERRCGEAEAEASE